MRLLLILCILIVTTVHLSSQAPPQDIRQQGLNRKAPHQTSVNDHASLLDLIKSRPYKIDTPAGDDFKASFARLPGVEKLSKLKGEAYVEHVLDLRKAVEQEDGRTKARFRKAIEDHMDSKQVDEGLKTTVKARLNQVTKAGVEKAYRMRKQAHDSIAWKLKIKEKYAAIQQKNKERKALNGKVSPFEKMMADLNLPAGTSAAEIEEKSRHIIIETPQYTTPQLRKFLKSRFDPIDVKNAIATRSFYYGRKANKRDYWTNGIKRRRVDQRKQAGDIRQSAASIASPSSSASIVRFDKPASLGPTHLDIDPLGKEFHQGEWWNDMYTK